jgi:P pilus assembly chaperone PapD
MTMFSRVTRHLFHSSLGAFALLLSAQAQADGMVPNTSVVIVNEADGEASVSVTNTDANLALMHVTLEDIAEDGESLVFVTPPLARVEAGKTQLVRFILQSEKPLLTQRLKRVIFEGIPQGKAPAEAGQARVGVTVRQNLPVILHPKGLVRLGQEVQLLPAAVNAMLPKTYVLPGEHISIKVPEGAATQVRFQPATVYGFAVPHYEAPIQS